MHALNQTYDGGGYRSWQQWQQPQRYTSYLRDANESDEAMHRRYNRWWGRFNQPDPSDGSYNLGDPQSLNRYSYVQNDPVNYVDPAGLNPISPGTTFSSGILWTIWYGSNADGWRIVHQYFEAFGGDQQNSTPTGQPSQNLPGCAFNVSITHNNLLDSKQLQAMKQEIKRVFATAGQEINFVSSNANYSLNINARGANYTNNPEAIGVTYLNGSAVTNDGRVFVDRLTASATSDSSSATAFNQNSNALAIGLGRAGSHEIGHYLLQQNYDSSKINGVMNAGFKGAQWFSHSTQGEWKFTDAQVNQLNSLCGRSG